MTGTLLQSISDFVNTAVNQVSNFVSNVASNLSATVSTSQNLLQNAATSINTTIAAIANPVQTTYTQQYVQAQPLSLPGTIPATNSLVNYTNLSNIVNGLFSQLPNIISTIQDPFSSPYLAGLINFISQLVQQNVGVINDIDRLITALKSDMFQSASKTAGLVGLDVGNLQNILDATVRTIMVNLGYSMNEQTAAIDAAYQRGDKQLSDAISQTQSQLGTFIQKVQTILQSEADLRAQQALLPHVEPTKPPEDIIQGAIDSAGTELAKVLKHTIDYNLNDPRSFIQQISKRVDEISGVVQKLKDGKYTSTEQLFNDLFQSKEATGLARGLIILATIIPTLIEAVKLSGDPALEAFSHLVNSDSPVKILSMADYITAYFKHAITFDYLLDHSKRQGYNEEQLKVLLEASTQELDLNTMISARLRGMVDDKTWNSYLFNNRYDDTVINILTQVMHILPNAPDLTRIADKQVWQKSIPAKYGQYAELPAEYIQYMQQLGLDEQFTRWIWAAHWELPSPAQIFEMYQRDKISREDMDIYLRLTDWLPYFRDALVSISYNPISRVDIRRIYGQGLLDRAGVVRRYRDIGYAANDAELLADFTIKYENDVSDDSLTKVKRRVATAIEGLYARNKLSRDEAIARLVALDYSQEIANATIDVVSLEVDIDATVPKAPQYKQKAIDLTKSSYLKGLIPETEARQTLGALGLTADEVNNEILYLDLDRDITYKQKFVETFTKLFLQGSIDNVELTTQLNSAGFSPGEIGMIMRDISLQQQGKFKQITETQLKAWHKKGYVDDAFVESYLRYLGYDDNIIGLVMLGDYGIGAE